MYDIISWVFDRENIYHTQCPILIKVTENGESLFRGGATTRWFESHQKFTPHLVDILLGRIQNTLRIFVTVANKSEILEAVISGYDISTTIITKDKDRFTSITFSIKYAVNNFTLGMYHTPYSIFKDQHVNFILNITTGDSINRYSHQYFVGSSQGRVIGSKCGDGNKKDIHIMS